MRPDAKVYAMIEDLGNHSLRFLLGLPPTRSRSRDGLVLAVREAYEAGSIDGNEIITLWEAEGDEP